MILRCKKSYLLIIGTIFVLMLVFFSTKYTTKEHKRTIYCFDTVSDITILSRTEKPLDDCEKYLQNAELEMSADNPNALIYKYNSGENVEFSKDLKDLLAFSTDFTNNNYEYFSIYLEPLIKAWDIKNNKGTIPDVKLFLSKVASENKINLGAVAKGFATEKLIEILKKDGISSALINLGGNAYAMGKKATGENWKIGIQSPKDENEIIGIITAEDISVITSGDYQRYFEFNNVKYHHILDPKTGYPANNELHSVTIVSSNPALADALSTACFVAGLDAGINLLNKYDCYGIFVTDDTVYFSKQLESIFKQTDFSYKYEFIY